MNQGIYGTNRADGGDPSRPWATRQQAVDSTSTTASMSPARTRDFLHSYLLADANQFPATGSGGTASAGSASLILNTSTTAGSFALYRAGLFQATLSLGRTINSINWSQYHRFTIRYTRMSNVSTDCIFRCQLGRDFNTTTIAQLNRRGIGFEIRNQRLWLLAHNGTSLAAVDSGSDAYVQAVGYEVAVESDGSGNVTLFLNGNSVATTSAGPTGTSSTAFDALAVELTNGTDGTVQLVYLNRYVWVASQ